VSNQSVATILIADYDVRTRERCSSRLNTGGFNVISIAGGQDALETALAARPDIVSATIFLPAISGVELCRRLKHDRRTTNIRVILHSSTALLPRQCRQLMMRPPEAPLGLSRNRSQHGQVDAQASVVRDHFHV